MQNPVDRCATLLFSLLIKTTHFWVEFSEHCLRTDFADSRNLSAALAAPGVLASSATGEPA